MKTRVENYKDLISAMSPADALECLQRAYGGGWITQAEYRELLDWPLPKTNAPRVNSPGGCA